jgi:N-acetylmuramoyl-L-alanine amidase
MLSALIAALLIIPPAITDFGSPRVDSIVNVIVIDPGHGGSDKGAVGPSGLLEKDVTLAVAFQLRDLILSDPHLKESGVKVVLTREDDRDVSLEERATIANGVAGDLLISIHTNSFTYSGVYGPETYFLSLKASDEHARKVAEVENSSFGNNGGSPVEDEDLKQILFDVKHKSHIEESMSLAKEIQGEFNNNLKLRDRGVKQAPFRVLKSVAMPAVLVEVDFISNPAREKLLQDENYQSLIARSLLGAVKRYKLLKENGLSGGAGSDGSS